MKVTYLDVRCANLDCENRVGEGAFVLLRSTIGGTGTPTRPFTLLLCGPCSTSFAEKGPNRP